MEEDDGGEAEEMFEVVREWEQINLPSLPPPILQPHQPHWRRRKEPKPDDDHLLSIFPPSNHEDLHISSPPKHHRSPPPDLHWDAPPPPPPPSHSRMLGFLHKQFNLGFRLVFSRFLRLASFATSQGRGTSFNWPFFTSAGGVTVALLAVLWYLKCQRRRQMSKIETLILLVRDQDAKINLLLDQITQLNELLLSSGRRVHVLRSV